jgi:hypothetical protein
MAGAYLFGIGAVVVFWAFSFATTGSWEPWALAISEASAGPRKLSASKFQALIWTLVTLFSYASIFGARLLSAGLAGAVTALPAIPGNLLLLMGLSAATAVGSKGVTISYKTKGIISQASGGLTTTPEGDADLVKTQMVVWSMVGAGIYLLTVANAVNRQLVAAAQVALPDVDGALLVLMGISQGTYFGNKLVSRDVEAKIELSGILPLKAAAGTTVTLTGCAFGAQQENSFVTLDDVPVRTAQDGLVAWSDNQVQVTIPTSYKRGAKVSVRLYCNGEWSDQRVLEVA